MINIFEFFIDGTWPIPVTTSLILFILLPIPVHFVFVGLSVITAMFIFWKKCSAKAHARHALTSQGRGFRIRCISAADVRWHFYPRQRVFRRACSYTLCGGGRHSQRCAGYSCFRILGSGSQKWAPSTAGRCRLSLSIRTTRKESPNQSVEPTALPLEVGVYS